MNFPDLLLPSFMIGLSNLLALLLLGHCLLRAPWRLIANSNLQHLWMAGCVGLLLVWSVKAGIKPGLNFHLLGATLLTLMFGPRLAMISLATVLIGVTLTGASGWSSLGVNFLLMAALPTIFSYAVYSQAHHKLPTHVFVYIFIDAFVTAGLAMILCGLVAVVLLAASEVYSMQYLGREYLPYFILMGWSEAILTGMAVTLMVVYRPQWLATFSDQQYVKGW
jgi:uncharacterized membrane protein